MHRILEPEVMDSPTEAIAYDAMDFTEVNTAFAQRAIELGPTQGLVLDAGTGTARIPIIICQMLAQHDLEWRIVGIDLAKSMLEIGKRNVERARLSDRIRLECQDAKQLPYPDRHFDLVISNSIVHHLPDPQPFFRELKRVLKPEGGIFLRDLMRLDSTDTINNLVERIASDCDEHQKKLFRDSLHAAFTLEEIAEFLKTAGLENVKLYQSSDRHWTAERVYSPIY